MESIAYPEPEDTAFADCPIEKFTKYIFSDTYAWNGKRALLESLGFTFKDSQRMVRPKGRITNNTSLGDR